MHAPWFTATSFFYLCNEWMCFKCLYRKPYDMFSRNLFWKIWAIFFPLFQFVGQLVFTICYRLLVFTFLSPLFYKVKKLGEMVAIREWKIFIDFSIDIGQRSRSNSLTWIFTLSNCPSPCTRYITLLVAAEL